MKKPTKPPPSPPVPPAPPLPPKPRACSPGAPFCSFPRQTIGSRSDYAESVASAAFSTKSLQPPPVRSRSPFGLYQYYGSESNFETQVNRSCGCCRCFSRHNCHDLQQSCATPCSESQSFHTACSQVIRNHSPCASTHSYHSYATTSASNVQFCHLCVPSNNSSRCYDLTNKPLPQAPLPTCQDQRQQNNQQYFPVLNERRTSTQKNISNECSFSHVDQCQRDVIDAPQYCTKSPAAPPTPKERIFRPRLSISPMPILRGENKNNSNESRDQTMNSVVSTLEERIRRKSLHYIRYMEHHVKRLFEYLKEREQRRLDCEKGIEKNEEYRSNADTIRHILRVKETRYLRELRAPISKADFEEVQRLGAGYIGKVSLVRRKTPSTDGKPNLFAMKKLKKSKVMVEGQIAHIMAERDILAYADSLSVDSSEWIVKLYYSFQDNDHLYFILEYVPGGDLMNLLCAEEVFSEEWARFYTAEISLAMQFVHDMGFIHRDIKPDNILIDAKGHIKLTDFGLCTGFRWTHDSSYYRVYTDKDPNSPVHNQTNGSDSLKNGNENDFQDHPTITRALTMREIKHSSRKRATSLVGSPNYIAPEVLRHGLPGPKEKKLDKINHQCDWWSLGVILYEMVIGYCPFIDLELLKRNQYNVLADPKDKIQQRILDWQQYLAFPSPNDPNSPPQMKGKDKKEIKYISRETEDLIKGLLCDPQDRLGQNGIKDIQGHPFFKGIDWKQIRELPAPYVPKLKDEMDTSHFIFDASSQMFELENIIGSGGVATNMRINDFTWKSFWDKPT